MLGFADMERRATFELALAEYYAKQDFLRRRGRSFENCMTIYPSRSKGDHRFSTGSSGSGPPLFCNAFKRNPRGDVGWPY